MSTAISTPEQRLLDASPRTAAIRQRVLACVVCQQRKVKCDRKFPCTNCVRGSVQCVPASLVPRQRRRRFPERELLERLEHYESLLRDNKIKFEPLHTPAAEKASPSEDGRGSNPADGAHSDRPSREKPNVKSETVYEAKNLWHAMNQRSRGPEDDEDDEDNIDGADDESYGRFPHDDDVREAVVKKAWDHLYESNDLLLFGSRKTNVELSTLHPQQVQIFRLWQIYLDNVNPLLKVTHTPTLQTRIIDAASDMANISPTLEALMFSIYCVSILSLVDDECRTLFGSPKDELLTNYQFACQQALLNCGFLRSGDLDCLTAFFLYLVSVRTATDPRSLSSILGVAIRIAQHMGIHSESTYAKCTALEAEMRRRLWWSLIIFDNRVCEMSDYRTTMLAPTWDCRPPLNVNDFDIRPEMKTQPAVHERPTEALFGVVRSELAEFVRHSAFHLDFTNPSLKPIAKGTQHSSVLDGSELDALEKTMEKKYFEFCNPENPLHFMTMWTARGYLAKNRLLEHYSRVSRPSMQQPDTQRDAAISHALSMLECDTKIMTSPLTKGYRWLVHFHFPFPAYIHIVQDLRKRPAEELAEKSWEVMSDNYEARFMNVEQDDNLVFDIFSRTILQAWEAREAFFSRLGRPLPQQPPRIVRDIRHKLMQTAAPNTHNSHTAQQQQQQPNGAVSMNADGDDFSMPMSMDFWTQGLPYGIGGQDSAGSQPGAYHEMRGQGPVDVDVNQLDWSTMYWNPMHVRGW